METIISVIGLLVAAVVFIVVIWKGLDVFTSTILVSFFIILTSWMQWWDALTAYADGYIGFIGNNLFGTGNRCCVRRADGIIGMCRVYC